MNEYKIYMYEHIHRGTSGQWASNDSGVVDSVFNDYFFGHFSNKASVGHVVRWALAFR